MMRLNRLYPPRVAIVLYFEYTEAWYFCCPALQRSPRLTQSAPCGQRRYWRDGREALTPADELSRGCEVETIQGDR